MTTGVTEGTEAEWDCGSLVSVQASRGRESAGVASR